MTEVKDKRKFKLIAYHYLKGKLEWIFEEEKNAKIKKSQISQEHDFHGRDIYSKIKIKKIIGGENVKEEVKCYKCKHPVAKHEEHGRPVVNQDDEPTQLYKCKVCGCVQDRVLETWGS